MQADNGRERVRLELFFGEPEGLAVLIWSADMDAESAYSPVGRLVDGHTVTNIDQIIGIVAHQYGIKTDVFTSAFNQITRATAHQYGVKTDWLTAGFERMVDNAAE